MQALSRYLTIVFGTGFGAGYAPIAPATVASLFICLLYWLFTPASWLITFLIAIAVFFLGIPLSNKGCEIWNDNDPGYIVIDEWAGQLIALIGIPRDPKWIIISFLLFRIFDIWKPSYIRESQKLTGGWGIMVDDLLAGLLTLLILHLLILL